MAWVATKHISNASTGFKVTPVETICKSENRYESLNQIMERLSYLGSTKVMIRKLSSNELIFIYTLDDSSYCITLTEES